jgi:hypothetical protein
MASGGLFIGEIKGLDYNVCSALIQPLHYNSAQSQGHCLGFTNVSVPSQSPADMCPLLERLAVDLRYDATFGGDETSNHLVLVEASIIDLYWASDNSGTSNRLVSAEPPSSCLKQDPNLHWLG